MITPSLLRPIWSSVFLFAAAPFVAAQNVWLVETGALVLTPSFTSQSYDTFYRGTAEFKLPDDITQQTTALRLDYGLTPRLALDASIGYTQVDYKPPGARFQRSGRDDSRLGLTYALMAESSERPALTWRVGAIIKGGYDAPTSAPPINPGDGASGFETSLAAGKALSAGFALYGELGYRNRDSGVPDDLFGSVGLAKQFGAWALNAGYRRSQGLSGGDIGGPGFGTRFGFPGVKEVQQFGELGLSFYDRGGRSYQVFGAKGFGKIRNTGQTLLLGAAMSIPFSF